MTQDFDTCVDARGLKCPQPLMMAKKAIGQITEGQIIKLEATDPHTDLDLQVWCERFGHHLNIVESNSETYTFYIEKK